MTLLCGQSFLPRGSHFRGIKFVKSNDRASLTMGSFAPLTLVMNGSFLPRPPRLAFRHLQNCKQWKAGRGLRTRRYERCGVLHALGMQFTLIADRVRRCITACAIIHKHRCNFAKCLVFSLPRYLNQSHISTARSNNSG